MLDRRVVSRRFVQGENEFDRVKTRSDPQILFSFCFT